MTSTGAQPFSTPVHVGVLFTFAGIPGTLPTAARDGDVDKLVKSPLDALNGIAFDDDRLVVTVSASKACGAADAVQVAIYYFVESSASVVLSLAACRVFQTI